LKQQLPILQSIFSDIDITKLEAILVVFLKVKEVY